MSDYLERPTRRVNFKSDPSLYADLYTELEWADSKAFRDATEDDQGLFRLIKDWNVPGLDLTYDNLGRLKRVDISVLFEAFYEIINAEAEQLTGKKKEMKSNSSKPPSNSPAENSTPPTP